MAIWPAGQLVPHLHGSHKHVCMQRAGPGMGLSAGLSQPALKDSVLHHLNKWALLMPQSSHALPPPLLPRLEGMGPGKSLFQFRPLHLTQKTISVSSLAKPLLQGNDPLIARPHTVDWKDWSLVPCFPRQPQSLAQTHFEPHTQPQGTRPDPRRTVWSRPQAQGGQKRPLPMQQQGKGLVGTQGILAWGT